LNNVENVEYIADKAENAIESVIRNLSVDSNIEIITILDPPRAGVHSSVITAIRGNDAIEKVIFIACDAKAATQNFIDLCRPSSNRYRGKPFRPVRAQPVDLFPHTEHCELIVEFQR